MVHVEKAPEGFYVKHDNGYVHLTVAWLEAIHRDQIKPRQAVDDGRRVPADGEREWNILYHAVKSGVNDPDRMAVLFDGFYSEIRRNRINRANLGLKAVTRDGDEDLRAVAAGAPVRAHNATHVKNELHEWIREQRGNR